jgi:hypothetical protein
MDQFYYKDLNESYNILNNGKNYHAKVVKEKWPIDIILYIKYEIFKIGYGE